MNQEWSRQFRAACRAMIAVGLLNFVIFVAVSLYLGGDAVNGKVEGGHYYLHGYSVRSGEKEYTKVSERVFTYSKWHVYSVLITWPLMMAAGFVANRITKRSEGS